MSSKTPKPRGEDGSSSATTGRDVHLRNDSMLEDPMIAPVLLCTLILLAPPEQGHQLAAKGITSLTNPEVLYTVPKGHSIKLKRGGVSIVVVDNSAGDTKALSEHRAGYNGLASLTSASRSANLFVPNYAGLNFEHIHDGTLAVNREKFEPRRSAMQLRVVDEYTVELYQPPTANWKLESCGRYHLLADGVVEYTFECVPRADVFHNGLIGLFWASYINAPQDRAIHFRGRNSDQSAGTRWIRAESPAHGTASTHPPAGPLPELEIDVEFPLTLVNHPSDYIYTEPWYFGVSHGNAYVLMFRQRDQIWFAQSPTGGGRENPAWDFQWFVPDYKVGETYGFVMRAAYIPYESREQVERATRPHRMELNPD